MVIYIGADHRGFNLKQKLIPWLQNEGHEVFDCGNDHLDPLDDAVDFAKLVTQNIQNDSQAYGLLLCGSGIDMAIAANRFKGIRCALGINPNHVKHGRGNDHINCLSMPAEYIDENIAHEMITTFINTYPKQDEKYLRRVAKLDS
ncbi:hypothetical protein A2690_00695 [Candidatus Roizmanbacteria bacterium RIFCSPHIGHO2_01_FULL_39_12b]|uniref:Ribose-5-phosphate isomerase n=1 Tax=Candidatus Roizmanbacteria bacterium RIFCSPHIGHO2_01_FULL_39_12b TaxID=1802030 RepID=A0A1F7GAM8_9BACT|nr:MAG: hypothetical protein A2690_00695 [Candidatus Roizmanbacteria bacterium RIFCSPHIGHO2_01_FULL_39_12b]